MLGKSLIDFQTFLLKKDLGAFNLEYSPAQPLGDVGDENKRHFSEMTSMACIAQEHPCLECRFGEMAK